MRPFAHTNRTAKTPEMSQIGHVYLIPPCLTPFIGVTG